VGSGSAAPHAAEILLLIGLATQATTGQHRSPRLAAGPSSTPGGANTFRCYAKHWQC